MACMFLSLGAEEQANHEPCHILGPCAYVADSGPTMPNDPIYIYRIIVGGPPPVLRERRMITMQDRGINHEICAYLNGISLIKKA
jgi:hypothetical protein